MAINGAVSHADKLAAQAARPTFHNLANAQAQQDPQVQAKLADEAKVAADVANQQNAPAEKMTEPVHHSAKPQLTKSQSKSGARVTAMTDHPKFIRDAGSVLLSEDFEGTEFPPAGWDTLNTDPGWGWFLGTAQIGGTQCALCTWDQGHTPPLQQDEWLITPSLDVSGASAADLKVEFWMLKGYDYPHDFKVYVSTDDGATFTEVWDSYDVPYPDFEWYAVAVPLGSYAGGPNIRIAFQYYGLDADLFGLDDISVNDDVYVEPTGRCCSGDVNSPTCEDGVTEAYCNSVGGNWANGLNCTDNPCPIPGANDDCANATPISGPYPVQVDGTTVGATVDCPDDPDIGDWDAVWYSIELPYASNNVTVDFCGTLTSPPSISALLFTACGCDPANQIVRDDGYYYDCGDGVDVPFIEWDNVAGPGVIYYAVWTGGAKARSQQDFVFTVDVAEPPPPPENDDCSAATPIGDVTDLAFSTATATPDNTGYTTGPNIWYCYTASCDGKATVSLCGSSYDTKVAAYDGCSCTLGTALSTNDDFCSVQSQIQFNVVKDNTYLIEVGGYSTASGDGLLNVSCEETGPANPGDNCSDPLKIDIPTLPYTDLGQTTCGRGDDYNNTCMGSYDGGEDIVYEVTVAEAVDVDITLDPKGTTYTGIGLFDLCPADPSASCIDQSTNYGSDAHGMTCVHLEPGVYYLMIDTYPSPDCIPDFDLTISAATGCEAPENDDCANATEIGDVTDLAFNTDNATFDGPGGCQTAPNLWYVYTASCTGEATVGLCGSDYDTKMAVYDGAGCDSPMIDCNDDACGVQSELTFPCVEGNAYLIEVGGYSSNTGAGLLTTSCALPCVVECPAGATDEGEACGDDVNGGCNTDAVSPPLTPVTCGETVCGNLWADGDTRDTDWYVLVVDDFTHVTLKVVGELPLVAGFLETSDPGNITCDNATGYLSPYLAVDKCDTAVVEANLSPGTWWIFVGPQDFNGYPCSTGPYDYNMSVGCETIPAFYCAASGGCYEHISEVQVAEIDNVSACDGYADYSGMTANMEIGTGYPITITNGSPYSSDLCGVWIDWNHDLDFDDPGEMITLDVADGLGPYTGTITPPADAVPGTTGMRVRVVDGSFDALAPCGSSSYGEVEDYSVNVIAPIEYVMRPDTMYVFFKYGIEPVTCDMYMCDEMLPDGQSVDNMENVAMSISGCPVSLGTSDIITGGYAGMTGDVLHLPFDGGNYVSCQETAQGGLIWDNVDSFFDITYDIGGTPGQVSGQVVVRGHTSGDVNLDGKLDVSDLIYMVDFMFDDGPAPRVMQTADVNASGGMPDIGDLVSMVEYMFSDGTPLVHP
jgi:hypothetical protein